MLPLYQVEELARQRCESALANSQLTQEYKRATRKGKAERALERIIKENIYNGVGLGALKRDMIVILHRAAE